MPAPPPSRTWATSMAVVDPHDPRGYGMNTRYDKFVPTQPRDSGKSLYGDPETGKAGTIKHADSFGTDLAMRSATPPPIAEYDEWLKARNVRFCMTNHGTQKTGYRLRRIVVMRRAGASWKECGEAAGVSGSTAKEWVEMLPLGLGA